MVCCPSSCWRWRWRSSRRRARRPRRPRPQRRPRRAGPGRCRTSTWPARTAWARPATRRSKVWYTVAGGVLSDVYSPTIDNTNVETLQYVVTDGQTFTDLQTRDMTYTVRSTDESGMACRVTSTAKSGEVPAGHRLRHRPRPGRRRREHEARAGQGRAGPEGVRPVRRDDQRQRRRRVEQRWRGRRRRGRRHHGARQLRPRHRDERRRTATTPSRCTARCAPTGRSWRPAAATPAPPATGWPSSTPTTAWPRRTTRRSTATSCRRGRSTSGRTGGSRSRSASGTTKAQAIDVAGTSAHAPFDQTQDGVREDLADATTRV